MMEKIVMVAILILSIISLPLTIIYPHASSSLHLGPQRICFNITSNNYVSAVYKPIIQVLNLNARPNSTVNITLSLTNSSMPMMLKVPKFNLLGYTLGGKLVTINVNPLGSLCYGIPDLSISTPVFSAGVYMVFSGYITGVLSFSGNISKPLLIRLTDAGNLSIPIKIPLHASGKGIITLSNITYHVAISLVVKYSSLLNSGNYTILPLKPIGNFKGVPSYINGIYVIESNSYMTLLILYLYIVIAVGMIIAIIVKFRRKIIHIITFLKHFVKLTNPCLDKPK